MTINANVWKRLARSNRLVSLVNAKHLLPNEARAMSYIIARVNMMVPQKDRIFITDDTPMNTIDIGPKYYDSLRILREIALNHLCDVHIANFVVYAGNEEIMLHLAKLDNTKPQRLE